MVSHYVAQAGLKLLGSSNPPESVSQSAGMAGVSPHTWPPAHILISDFWLLKSDCSFKALVCHTLSLQPHITRASPLSIACLALWPPWQALERTTFSSIPCSLSWPCDHILANDDRYLAGQHGHVTIFWPIRIDPLQPAWPHDHILANEVEQATPGGPWMSA